MKRSIVTLGILALTVLNVNATEVKITSRTQTETSTDISRNKIVEVYDWNVNTDKGNYSGTSLSLEEAQRMIALVASGEVVYSKKIESFYQLASEVADKNKRLFFWEVETLNGRAKGYSSSESQAQKMIELVSTGTIVNFKIVENK